MKFSIIAALLIATQAAQLEEGNHPTTAPNYEVDAPKEIPDTEEEDLVDEDDLQFEFEGDMIPRD